MTLTSPDSTAAPSSVLSTFGLEGALHEVQKPSRYIGLELNSSRKAWDSASLRLCLAFPETYEIGMSHLGLMVLYWILNRMDGVLADRAYCPWPDMEKVMRSHGIPLWGLESRRPLAAFDIIGFSLQSELLYTNLITMLDLSAIPIRSADRRENDPLVIAGGPCTSNPEPYAPFVDAVCAGDGEELVEDLAGVTLRMREKGGTRDEILAELSTIDGVYVPSFYSASDDDSGHFSIVTPLREGIPARVRRRFVDELDERWIPFPPLVPAATPVQDRLNLEISRGCTRGCRFCHAGYFQRPLRERNPERILEAAIRGISVSGFDELNLLSLSTADYGPLIPLMDGLVSSLSSRKTALSVPSLRVDSMRGDIAERILQVKKTGFTFAPEAGTQRLRNVINKLFTEDTILNAIDSAFDHGWRHVKLYFMIGLPTESDEDIEGIIRLVRKIEHLGRKGQGKLLHVSVGAFVPKSHTPFQWEPFENVCTLERRLNHLKNSLTGKRITVKWQNLKASFLEATLARGDRRCAAVLERAWRYGARFDSWTEQLHPEVWDRSFADEGIDPLLFTGRWETRLPLPWDVIDTGISKEYLLGELEKARRGEATVDCRSGNCQGCGLPGAPGDVRLAGPVAGILTPHRRPTGRRSPRLRRNLRIRYSVTGMARFLTHLERGNILKKTLVRSDLEPIYTEGFSPRPKMMLGPPLPVGIGSIAELVDCLIGSPHLVSSIAGQISRCLPDGMSLEGLMVDFPDCFLPLHEICSVLYEFDFSLAPVGAWEQCLLSFERFTDSERFLITKVRKGKCREIDLKGAIRSFDHSRVSCRTFFFTIYCNHPDGTNAGPREVLDGVFGLKPPEYRWARVTRRRYYDARNLPFPELQLPE